MKILIIDDDPDDTELFCLALSDIIPNAICWPVHDADSALLLLETTLQIPEYIFLDAHMILMDGMECLFELRKMDRLSQTKIIMYSGYASESDIQKFISCGAYTFIKKPDRYGELRATLKSLLEEVSQDIIR